MLVYTPGAAGARPRLHGHDDAAAAARGRGRSLRRSWRRRPPTGIRLNVRAPRGGVGRQRLGHVVGRCRAARRRRSRRTAGGRGPPSPRRVAAAASARESPNPTHTARPCSPVALGARPSSAAAASTRARDVAHRSGPTKTPSQPSPRRAARRRAASLRPPTTIGTGRGGAGETRAPCTDRTSPSRSTVSPARRPRTTVRHSSIRRPRVRGSTPHTSSSWRVVAAQADAEHEPARRQLRERRDLARHRDRVAQRQEVHRGVHREATTSPPARWPAPARRSRSRRGS